jgi:hypothetical protein
MDTEAAVYRDPVLSPLTPTLHETHANTDGALRSHDGAYAFPPFLAVQQGLTLCKWWAAARRTPSEVRSMVSAVAGHLAALHASGSVHAAMRADGVLFMPRSREWRLLGLAHAVPIGAFQASSRHWCRNFLIAGVFVL